MARPDASDHAVMAALIQQEQRARAQLTEARERFQLWRGRLEKAEQLGRHDLLDEIERELHEARAQGLAAKHDLERLEMEKSALRHESRLGSSEAAASHAQAEHLLGEFAAMGVRPEDEALRQLSRDQESDDMLAALKARMKGDG